MRQIFIAILLVLPVLALPRLAPAETRRIAVVVGHNAGGAASQSLRYAEEDAGKLAYVMAELGGVASDDLFLVQGKGLASVKEALDKARARVKEVKARPEDRSIVLFFYSGHADGTALELGSERFPFDELRASLAATGADVRVAIVDSCKSGALLREKGGKQGPAFEIRLTDELETSGDAFLTSSAADEVALESSEIHGSFFTHHLVSGLRGAADDSGDGRVTLSEAYQYTFHRTVASSSQSGAEPQHPEYDYRLSGQGELVLTEGRNDGTRLDLPEGFDRALIIRVQRDQVIAELTDATRRQVAVAAGEYAVRLWKGDKSFSGRVRVDVGEKRAIDWKDLAPVTAAAVAAKGGVSPNEREWEEKYLEFADDVEIKGVAAGKHGGAFAGKGTVKPGYTVFRGRHKESLTATEYYRYVGRTDLADQYDRREARRKRFYTGGAIGTVGGIVAFGAGLALLSTMDDDYQLLGRGLTAGGLVGAMVSISVMSYAKRMNSHPISPSEYRRLGAQYNDDLADRLGIERSQPVHHTSGPSAQIVPYVGDDGAGVAVVGEF